MLYSTHNFPSDIACSLPDTAAYKPPSVLHLTQGPVHVAINPIKDNGVPAGSMVLVHDMSFVERRSADTKQYVIILFVILSVVISIITVFIAHLSWRGWLNGMRAMLHGEGLVRPFAQPVNSELQPLVGDLRALLRTMDSERRFADDVTIAWTPESLRGLLHKQLDGDQVLVVSNREPYIHMKGKEGIEVRRPASGDRKSVV